VKPLLNLSQTCFLSAILQALLHNPLWKQYYLSSGHDRKQCALRRAKKLVHGNNKYQPTESIAEGSGLGAEENGPGGLIGVKLSDLGLGLGECMNCEMDGAFAEAYGGDSTPFGPITMLFAMWKANTELAGYAQQDAHAFFLAALNQIHMHDPDCVESPKNCACIAHRTFGGSLLSTVTCSRCGSMTETEDPILDLSLELKKGAPAMDRLTAVERCSPSASLNLADCLRTFTSKESLKDDVYACEKCKAEGRRADVSKQLSFKTLPATLAIQLKRFEHANSNLVKVDTLVNFPTELDMRPYMTDQLRGDTFDMPLEMFHYRLTSVVTHEGKLDNGHYWACVNSGHAWFLMDDEKVTPIALSRVLAQKAYMLFYAKSSLTFA
ncbi:hypothetical protein HD553DRAFT_268229, partial [Filobasidium floriforme]|uniref:uncharacterized protein n=1 Tax=Filobasidium floriforme TaxID=5210 RepID=UPI001E8D47B5